MIYFMFYIENKCLWYCYSYEDQKPVDKHIEQKDRVDGDDIFVFFDYNVHEWDGAWFKR